MTTPIPKLFQQICVIAYLQHSVVLASTARFRENAQHFAGRLAVLQTCFWNPGHHQKDNGCCASGRVQ